MAKLSYRFSEPVHLEHCSRFCLLWLGKGESDLNRINESLIIAAYCIEVTNPWYKRKQHFRNFKIVYNIKLCPIPFFTLNLTQNNQQLKSLYVFSAFSKPLSYTHITS